MKFTFWNGYLISTAIIVCICLFLLLAGCGQNTRHSIGITGKPLSTNMEQNLKMNYKIIFVKVRPKEDDDD